MLHSVLTSREAKHDAATSDDALNAVADVDDAECWTLSWQSMMLQQGAGQVTQVYSVTRSGSRCSICSTS